MLHPLYKVSHRLSLLGIQPQDLVVLLIAFNVGLQLLGVFFPGRLRILFALVFIVVLFRAWQLIRDRLPDKFFRHLFLWLSEADVYRARPALRAIPLLVDPAALRQGKATPPAAAGAGPIRASEPAPALPGSKALPHAGGEEGAPGEAATSALPSDETDVPALARRHSHATEGGVHVL